MLSAYGDAPPSTNPGPGKRRSPPPPKLRLVPDEEEPRTGDKRPPKTRPGLY